MAIRTRGFTLRDLLVVLAIVSTLAILVTVMTPPPTSLCLDAVKRAECMANLNYIGKAFTMYADEENGRFPLLWSTGRPEADIANSDSARTIEQLRANLDGREAAMQNVWLLIDKGLIIEDAFQCPSDKDYRPRRFTQPGESIAVRMANRVGWRSSENFSYGLHFPYKSTTVDGRTVDNPAYLGPQMKRSFVIMADKNPSQNNEPATGVGPDKSPSNHKTGETYLMYDGSVDRKVSYEDSNINGEDIYTIQTRNNANPATPAGGDDQYIVRHPALPKRRLPK